MIPRNEAQKRLLKKFDTKVKIKKREILVIEGRKEEIYSDYMALWCNPLELYGELAITAMNSKLNNFLTFETRYSQKIKDMQNKNIHSNGIKDFYIEHEGTLFDILKLDFKNGSKEIVYIKANEGS